MAYHVPETLDAQTFLREIKSLCGRCEISEWGPHTDGRWLSMRISFEDFVKDAIGGKEIYYNKRIDKSAIEIRYQKMPKEGTVHRLLMEIDISHHRELVEKYGLIRY